MSDFDELMSLGPRWYVAHTYSGYENKVKTNLEKIVENRGNNNSDASKLYIGSSKSGRKYLQLLSPI